MIPSWLGQVASQIVIAVVAAYTTVRLSTRAFSSQKWWERKADAYSSIIEALSNELADSWRLLDAEERHPDESKVSSPEQIARRQEALRRIYQAAAMGAYIISDAAAGHLEVLRRELAAADSATSLYDFVGNEYAAMNKCIAALRQCAHSDLGLRRR